MENTYCPTILEQTYWDEILCVKVINNTTKIPIWRARGKINNEFIIPMEESIERFKTLDEWVAFVKVYHKIDVTPVVHYTILDDLLGLTNYSIPWFVRNCFFP